MANNRSLFHRIIEISTPPVDRHTNTSGTFSGITSGDSSATNRFAALSFTGMNLFARSTSSAATEELPQMPLNMSQIVDYRILEDLDDDELESKSAPPSSSKHPTIKRSKSDSDLLSSERFHRGLSNF